MFSCSFLTLSLALLLPAASAEPCQLSNGCPNLSSHSLDLSSLRGYVRTHRHACVYVLTCTRHTNYVLTYLGLCSLTTELVASMQLFAHGCQSVYSHVRCPSGHSTLVQDVPLECRMTPTPTHTRTLQYNGGTGYTLMPTQT